MSGTRTRAAEASGAPPPDRAGAPEPTRIPGRAWLVLVAVVVILLLAFGIRGSFGLFLRPMSTDLGWGREVFAMAIAIQNLVWGISQPLFGAIADRFGTGRVVAVAGALYAWGLWEMGTTTDPVGLTLSAGVILGLALSGTGFPILLAALGRSVPESRRSLFLGLGSAGGSSGQLLMVPLAQGLIGTYGWQSALINLAALTALMVPLAACLSGRGVAGGSMLRHQTMGEAIREAGGHGGFWLLTAGFFVCGFHVTFIGTHLPAYLVDRGIPASVGAVALAVIGLGNIVGSMGCGVLGGYFRKKHVLAGIYLARSVVIGLFVSLPISETSVLVFAFSIGLLWLGTVPLTSALVAEIFGVRYMATLFGFVFFSHQIGSFLGAWYGGRVFDMTGSYELVWWMAVGLGIVAAILHWPIRDQAMARLAPAPAGQGSG